MRGDVAALNIELGLAEPGLHPLRRKPRVDADAAVPPALGCHERRLPAGRRAGRVGNLLVECADLLNAHDVGLRAFQEVREPLLHAGPDPVDVPANHAHRLPLCLPYDWMPTLR